jgi:hypothetical protein
LSPVALALWRSAALAEAGGNEIHIVSEADQRALAAAGKICDE